jgi:hypothetical protein
MLRMNFVLRTFVLVHFLCCSFATAKTAGTDPVFFGKIRLISGDTANSRISYGFGLFETALRDLAYSTEKAHAITFGAKGLVQVIAGVNGTAVIKEAGQSLKMPLTTSTAKEHFRIVIKNGIVVVVGADPTGVMYGLMELRERLLTIKSMPTSLDIEDGPEMLLRGSCIGVQKPAYLPGRLVYEYPYTPESFPWFYDKELWTRVLDSMANNRMNALFLWNGHPFASLVKLKDYPYALEVDEATFKKNEAIYGYITKEAERRGIWVIQMFYNIIVSKPFAEHHGIKTQDRNRPIVPLIADYTKQSIAAFVEKYPNVGLMVALGEAMEGVGQDDIDWFTKTIIPGVKQGLAALGKTEEPPIVLRSHDTDAPAVMRAALPLYKNLYTESKYNGESLTTYTPRGPWAELHRKLSALGSVQLENVHILSNLEPFRYASPDFIQKSVIAMHEVHKGNALHLYPQASYWDWPFTADKTEKRLLQIDRDWMWYKGWSRYAWKAKRDRNSEMVYWSGMLANQFGLNRDASLNVLKAYEASGEIAPKILRRFGITDGNRQTMTLGMLMPQLINPHRFGVISLLYDSEGPEGEMLIEYAEKEWKGLPHVGETPIRGINEILEHGKQAALAIELALPHVKKNRDEFMRLRNDMKIYDQLAKHYAAKAAAALHVLRYKYSTDLADLEKGYLDLKKSMLYFDSLVLLTKDSYLYANSMQTQQRRIPVGGDNGNNKTWVELKPIYEEELSIFRFKIDSLKAPVAKITSPGYKAIPATINWEINGLKTFPVTVGKEVFLDSNVYVKNFDESLKGMQGLKLSYKMMGKPTTIAFSCEEPVDILVGYFNSTDAKFLQKPKLETDASGNVYGQAEPRLRNAFVVNGGMPVLDVHTYSFTAGRHELKFAKGIYLILGAVSRSNALPSYDAGLTTTGVKRELDWLFEK